MLVVYSSLKQLAIELPSARAYCYFENYPTRVWACLPRQHHSSGPPVAMSGKKPLVDHQWYAGDNRKVGFATDEPSVGHHRQTM